MNKHYKRFLVGTSWLLSIIIFSILLWFVFDSVFTFLIFGEMNNLAILIVGGIIIVACYLIGALTEGEDND